MESFLRGYQSSLIDKLEKPVQEYNIKIKVKIKNKK